MPESAAVVGTETGSAPASGGPASVHAAYQAATAEPATSSPSAASAPVTSSESATTAPAPGLFKDLSEAEARYKGLQKNLDRLLKEHDALSPYGGPSQAAQHLQLLTQLARDPEIVALLEAREAKAQTGSGDPETVAALQLVHQIAEQRAQQLIAPLQAKELERTITSLFGEMSKAHPGWEHYRPQIKALYDARLASGALNASVDSNPTFEVLEDLYLAVAARDPAWRKASYEREHLRPKQAADMIASPGTVPSGTGTPKAKSLREAMSQALAMHGRA